VSSALLCCNRRMYEDHRLFQTVTVMTSQPGKMLGIDSAYDAARFLLEEWPVDEGRSARSMMSERSGTSIADALPARRGPSAAYGSRSCRE
jgi:hypothetical protein